MESNKKETEMNRMNRNKNRETENRMRDGNGRSDQRTERIDGRWGLRRDRKMDRMNGINEINYKFDRGLGLLG